MASVFPSALPSSAPFRVLAVDDDCKFCALLADYLRPFGFEVEAAHSGPDGLAKVEAGGYDAVILDVMLPGLDGHEVLRRIRAVSAVPVLMLTALGEEADRIVGLESGADDYLPKTFSTRELLARLRAVVRRSRLGGLSRSDKPDQEPDGDEELRSAGLRINFSRHEVEMDGQPVELTPVEYSLLAALLRARGRVCSRELLLEKVRQRDYDIYDRSIDVHVSSLRRKLGDDAREGRLIRTVRAAGYQWAGPPPRPAEGKGAAT